MNIAIGTHKERCYQLSELLKQFDDNTANHYIWVDRSGGVHLEVRGPSVPSDALFYSETFNSGNQYIGIEASTDREYINRLVNFLEGWWNYCTRNPPSNPKFADYPAPQ